MAHKIILGCDPGHDDVIATLQAHGNLDIEPPAVTTVAGNQTLDEVTHKAPSAARVAGMTGALIAAGCPGPLARGIELAPEIHGESRLDDPELPDPDRGVRKAAKHVNTVMSDTLTSGAFATLADLDHELCRLDGTSDKSRPGAHVIVSVSMAAQAFAGAADMPLWQYLSPAGVPQLPVPHFNGDRHAPKSLAFQEFMIAQVGATTMTDTVRAGVEVHARLRTLIQERGLSTGLGEEGGFASRLARPDEVLRMLVHASGAACYEASPGGVELALAPAASEFCEDEICIW